MVTQEYSVLPLRQFVTLLTHTRNQPRGKSIALLLAQQQDISVFGPLIPKLEELISMGLADGNVSIDVIGHSLGLHPRKLQRLLAKEGLSYSQVLDNVRQQHARQYITHTQFDMSSIAYMLGYKNLATFSRECKKWFGGSPSQLRKMTDL